MSLSFLNTWQWLQSGHSQNWTAVLHLQGTVFQRQVQGPYASGSFECVLKNADTQAFPTSVTSEFLPVGPRNLYFQEATRWFLSTLQAWQPVLEVSLHVSTQYMKLLISEFYSQDTCSFKFLRAPHRSPPYRSYHIRHERHSTRQCGCISTNSPPFRKTQF